MPSTRSALFFGLAAFLLNPGYACSSAEPGYQYGEAELRDAVEGDWALSVSPSTGAALELTLHLEQRAEQTASATRPGVSLLRSAHACGTRTLLASARACIDASEMPLAVGYVAGEPSFAAAELTGNFRVDSLVFDVGILYLALGDLRITAQLDTEGNVTSANVDNQPADASRVSLQRIAR